MTLSIGSDNSLLPVWQQKNFESMLAYCKLETNFNEIWIKLQLFLLKKIYLNRLFVRYQSFSISLVSVLRGVFQGFSGYGLSQWETTLHCNVISHWLSPYTDWSLVFGLNMVCSYFGQKVDACIYSVTHSGYGLSQWEMMLHCNIVSHWLSTYPEWSLVLGLNMVCSYFGQKVDACIYSVTEWLGANREYFMELLPLFSSSGR